MNSHFLLYFSLNFFRFIDLVTNSHLEKRLIQDYVIHLRVEYLLKHIHLTCEERFIPSDFISSHYEKLSQMVGDTNFDETSSNSSKDDINFGAELFMALNSCPTFYVKLYWKIIYGNVSIISKFASNVIRKAEDGFKVKAQKIFAKISSVIGFQHISYYHEGNKSIAMNIDLSKNMDVKGD